MYKNKDKQREANRQAQARFKAKGITKGITEQGITKPNNIDLKLCKCGWPGTIDDSDVNQPSTKRGHDIKCFEDLPPDVQQTIDRMSIVDGKIDQTIKANRTAIAVNYQHLFPDSYGLGMCPVCTGVVVGKPGDADYNGICTEVWRAERGR